MAFSITSVTAYLKENASNVIEVAESLTSLPVICFGFMKCLFCIIKSEEMFGIINEIKELNNKCKLTLKSLM